MRRMPGLVVFGMDEFKTTARNTKRIDCPNCGERIIQAVAKEKASCPRCGNVWAWKKVRARVVSLRRAG